MGLSAPEPLPTGPAPGWLTAEQKRFAAEHDAHPGCRPAGHPEAIFMYHRGAWITERWLVDPRGRVLEMAALH